MVEDSFDLSLAVLGYRAGRSLIPFVEELHARLSQTRLRWELIIVANYWPGAADETPAVAAELAERLPGVRRIAEPKAGAMGWDMRRGLEACRGRWVGVIDGDGQFPAEAVLACYEKAEAEDLDLVKTYRARRQDGFYRRFISWVFNGVFRLLFPQLRRCRDANSKPKLLRGRVFEAMRLTSDDWFLDAEIMLEAVRLGLRFAEVPVSFRSLDARPSFVRPSTILEFVVNLVRFRLRYRFEPPGERGAP